MQWRGKNIAMLELVSMGLASSLTLITVYLIALKIKYWLHFTLIYAFWFEIFREWCYRSQEENINNAVRGISFYIY